MNHDEVQQSRLVNELHNLPRFGHGSSIAGLASHDRSNQEDYIRGMLSFCFFLLLIVYMWLFVLIVLKVAMPRSWVGCAAGGKVLDVAKMRKAKVPRQKRRRQIVRAWRLQWAFLCCSILIPIMTLLMTRNGLTPFINSLDEVSSISDEVEAVAFHGIAIAKELQDARSNLANLTLFSHSNERQQPMQELALETSCPTLFLPNHGTPINNSLPALPPIATIHSYIDEGLSEVKTFIDFYAMDAHIGLQKVVNATESVNSSIVWIYQNDWLLKFFLLTINVVNGFFLFGVFLTKQDIVNYKYQRYLTLWVIPSFVGLVICCAILACAFGMAAMLNADFCHGNASVNGSMQEILVESGVRESDLTYQAFRHYMEGCLGESPMGFIHEVDSVIKYTRDAANLLGPPTSKILQDQCSREISVLVSQMNNVTLIMDNVQRQVRAVIELSGCHRTVPVLRRIIHGATCSETVDSLAWLFWGLCFIALMGLILVSVRAALFNSVIRAPRRKRYREREKEFAEYKQYMEAYYLDTLHWELEGAFADTTKRYPEFTLAQFPTFETEDVSRTSHEGEGDDEGDSEVACFASPVARSDDMDASASSYESDYSSDDSLDQQSSISFSMLSRFFPNTLGNDQSSVFDAESHIAGGKSQLSVLQLQTPQQRRRQSSSALGSYLYRRSPTSDAGAAGTRAAIGSSPQRSENSCDTPPAPSKPRQHVHRTNGATPSAPFKPKNFVYRTTGAATKHE